MAITHSYIIDLNRFIGTRRIIMCIHLNDNVYAMHLIRVWLVKIFHNQSLIHSGIRLCSITSLQLEVECSLAISLIDLPFSSNDSSRLSFSVINISSISFGESMKAARWRGLLPFLFSWNFNFGRVLANCCTICEEPPRMASCITLHSKSSFKSTKK